MSAPLGTIPLAVGQKVMYKGKDATVRFRGETGFERGLWLGLEMATPGGAGFHNGSYVENVRYFECPKGHGVFVRETQVTRHSDTDSSSAGSVSKEEATEEPTPVTETTAVVPEAEQLDEGKETEVKDEAEADSFPPPVLDTTAEKKSASPDRAALVPTETTETVNEETAEEEEEDAVPAKAKSATPARAASVPASAPEVADDVATVVAGESTPNATLHLSPRRTEAAASVVPRRITKLREHARGGAGGLDHRRSAADGGVSLTVEIFERAQGYIASLYDLPTPQSADDMVVFMMERVGDLNLLQNQVEAYNKNREETTARFTKLGPEWTAAEEKMKEQEKQLQTATLEIVRLQQQVRLQQALLPSKQRNTNPQQRNDQRTFSFHSSYAAVLRGIQEQDWVPAVTDLAPTNASPRRTTVVRQSRVSAPANPQSQPPPPPANTTASPVEAGSPLRGPAVALSAARPELQREAALGLANSPGPVGGKSSVRRPGRGEVKGRPATSTGARIRATF